MKLEVQPFQSITNLTSIQLKILHHQHFACLTKMTTDRTNDIFLLVDLDHSLAATLGTNNYHILTLEKAELSTLTIEEFCAQVTALLRAIETGSQPSRHKNRSQWSSYQRGAIALGPVLLTAAEPKC